ncbi:esterase/lipase family protein [Rhizobium ruizarguesonis]
MTLVVGVHGIAQQRKGPEVLRSEWEPSLRDGVHLAGGELPPHALSCAFYGDLFRQAGTVRAAGDEHFQASDVTEDEAELLEALLAGARRGEPERFSPADVAVRASTPGSVQAGLRLLAQSRFFTGIAERAMIGDLKQVRRYIREQAIRGAAQAAVDATVTTETRVLVGHSLGSVVAYEALHRYGGTPRWANVSHFVTLGSPLGISNLIFEQLVPKPQAGMGEGPNIARWTNISDDGDIVALVKKLGQLFSGPLDDYCIDNGATAHDIKPYLTASQTGSAIRCGLA